MVHERNKVNFFWVLVVFMITISMAYADKLSAKSVQEYNQEQLLKKKQRDIDFPVVEHWSAGRGERAIWVNPRQPVSPIDVGTIGIRMQTPEYKIHLNSSQPQTGVNHPMRQYRSTAKLRLFSWN